MANDRYGRGGGEEQGRSHGGQQGDQFSLLALYKEQIVKYEAEIEELKRELEEAREQIGQADKSPVADNTWTESKPAPMPEPAKSNASLHFTYGIIILVLVTFAAIMYVYPGAFVGDDTGTDSRRTEYDNEQVAVPDSMAYAETADIVQDVEIYNSKLGTYRYSGSVNSDGMPDGEGEATFSNRDRFVGTFNNGDIIYGRYTWTQAGVYFEGSFINCEPDEKNGSYYDRNGNKQ